MVGLCFAVACGNVDHPPNVGEDPVSTGGTGGQTSGAAGKGSGSAGKPSKIMGYRDGGFINIPSVSDILYDDGRDVLYVSTTEGGLATVNLDSGEIATQPIGDGPLTGLDLSASGVQMAIGENLVDAENKQYWIHILDLSSSTIREVYFPQRFYLQEGSYSVAFANETTVFLTSSYTASGFVPLLELDLTSDTYKDRGDVVARTMVERSRDSSVIAVAQPKDGFGPLSTIDPTTYAITKFRADLMLHDAVLSDDGGLIALPSYGVVRVISGPADGFADKYSIMEDKRQAAAAVFDPQAEHLYVAWSKHAGDDTPAFVASYNAATGEVEKTLQKNIPLAENRTPGSFEPTRMEMSGDGSLMFVTVEKGVNVFPLTADAG